MKLLIIFVLVLGIIKPFVDSTYTFNEELFIETLPDHHVLFQFQFTSVYDQSKDSNVTDYYLFPKTIGEIVNEFKINKFRLTLTQGTWRYNNWGLPSISAPTGGELWAVFDSNIPKSLVDKNWIQSSRTISGLFGLSINLIDNPNTVQPRYSFASVLNESDYLRYASLPNEIVCTENLTPWFKLLPCVKYRGLGELFRKPYKLIESNYLSIVLDFKKTCLNPTCSKSGLELKQTLSLVYSLDSFSQNNLNSKEGFIWSFSLLFGEKLSSYCPIANESAIYVDLANTGIIDIEPTEKISFKPLDKIIYSFDLKKIFKNKQDELNPIAAYRKDSFVITAPITIHRYTTNMNERNFGIKSVIRNHHSSEKFKLVFLETIPWFFRVFASSLVIKKDDHTIIKPESIHFTPGLNYRQPHLLEIKLDLDPRSVYTIYFNAEYAYLKYDEYPPDVNHGFYINPAMLTIYSKTDKEMWPQIRQFEFYPSMKERFTKILKQTSETNQRIYKIYSEILLVNLPAPDFSMPYNVICLTCTVIAIAFGSIHNFTSRKFIFIESKSPIKKLQAFLKRLIKK